MDKILAGLWKKLFNWETISYLIFGVLTTLVDWFSYWLIRQMGINYLIATVGSWGAAVAFAFITNKLFVFRSYSFHWKILVREGIPFVACRALTGTFTMGAMWLMVDGLNIENDMLCKVVVSAISLVMNYVFSKWFIFKQQTASEE